MDKTGIVIYWSQDPGLVSNQITNIERVIKWIRMITNVVLSSVWGVAVRWTRVGSKSRVIESRDMKNNSNMGGPIQPSNNIFLREWES